MAVVVIGPPGAGKSTTAAVLAAQRGLDVICFDGRRTRWYGPFGYTEQAADDHYVRGGLPAWRAYTARYDVRALAGLVDATEDVIDTGGGIALQEAGSAEIRMLHDALGRAELAVLVCPYPDDPDRAADILAQRLAARQPGGTPGDWQRPDGAVLLQELTRASLSLREDVHLLIDTATGDVREQRRLTLATTEEN